MMLLHSGIWRKPTTTFASTELVKVFEHEIGAEIWSRKITLEKLLMLGIQHKKDKLENGCRWLRMSWWGSKSGQCQWELEGRRRLND